MRLAKYIKIYATQNSKLIFFKDDSNVDVEYTRIEKTGTRIQGEK